MTAETRDETTDPTGPEDPLSETEEPTMLLARMAESVYWGGRYLERAECTARIVQVHTDAHVDMPVGEDVGWEPLLSIAGVDVEFDEHYPKAADPGAGRAAEDDVIEFLLHSDKNPSSILGAISSARENLRTARPVVPREAWEAGNNLWLTCSDYLDETRSRKGRVQWLRRVIAGCQMINGILLGTMSRDEAMSFLTIGQNLERADLTTRVLDVRSENLHPKRGDDPYDVVHWMAVLRSLAAYQPFRRAMPARPQGGSTLRFLLQDDRFPRAVSACLTETRSQVKGLARAEDTLDACTNATMLVASAAVPRLTLGGLSEFLEEVQGAVRRQEPRREGVDRPGIEQIEHLDRHARQLAHRRACLGRRPRPDDHRRPRRREHAGRLEPDPRVSTRHDGHAISQVAIAERLARRGLLPVPRGQGRLLGRRHESRPFETSRLVARRRAASRGTLGTERVRRQSDRANGVSGSEP